MTLCVLCNSLTLAALFPPNYVHHAANFAALAASAETCRLCKMIHWCLEHQHNEADHKPTLDFDGATDVVTPYDQVDERKKCSVKLQIVPGPWNGKRPKGGFTYIGVWIMSRWMITDLTISVEEGMYHMLQQLLLLFSTDNPCR